MSTETSSTETCIDVCNHLLAGERAAVETYEKAVAKFAEEPFSGTLARLKENHQASVRTLEQNVERMGGQPKGDSGLWGGFANAIQASTNFFGENAAFKSLEAGTRKGMADYERALEKEKVLPDCQEMIRHELLPRLQENLSTLKKLEEGKI